MLGPVQLLVMELLINLPLPLPAVLKDQSLEMVVGVEEEVEEVVVPLPKLVKP